MKKIVTLVSAPILSSIVLFGCFGGGTALTTNNSKNKYNQLMDSYITTRLNTQYNDIFKNNLIKTGQENDEAGANNEKVLYVSYSNTTGLQDSINSPNALLTNKLKINYNQIRETYQRILSLSYNYYANWSDNFFTNIADTDITNSEINNLYSKLEKLERTIAEFRTSKVALEDAAAVDINREINISSVLANHHQEYVKLVEASFDFINYFRDLHVKYIFNTDSVRIQASQRLVDEALLLLAESVFYDNVKANQLVSRVDLYAFMTDEKSATSQYNWLAKDIWKNLTVNTASGIYAKREMNAQVFAGESTTVHNAILEGSEESETYKAAVARVRQLATYLKSFKQDLEFYKQIQKSNSAERYMYFRGLKTIPSILTFDKNNLSIEEKTDLQFMSEFGYGKLSTMFETVFSLIK